MIGGGGTSRICKSIIKINIILINEKRLLFFTLILIKRKGFKKEKSKQYYVKI